MKNNSEDEKSAHGFRFMQEIGIDMQEIQRRMDFVGFNKKDIQLLSEMQDFAQRYEEEIISTFYEHLLSVRETRILLKNQEAIDRLILSQKIYLMEIFQGNFNAAYFEQRLKTGAVHHRIGLKPKWYMEIYASYENHISTLISKAYKDEADRGLARDHAIRKIFRIDMILTLEYYMHSKDLEMTAKLNHNIQSIDDFTRMLSHDLKEPLRGIEAFSSFLLEDYPKLLDKQGKRYLNFLKESVTRMKTLIQDLLTLVSITQKGATLDQVNLNLLLEQVKDDLKFSIQQKKVVFVKNPPLPIVPCDAIQVTEIFKNLISNAIKFNTSSPPQIEVMAQEKGEFYLFSVKDNGIGIESAYQEQILRPFERLHHQGEYEGTGLGLAICKKVVEKVGGEIWLKSEKDIGSTFYFTLPKNNNY
ncbi:MAG: GHKL domain-containing protein [Nitrospirae bacterium]|nr:GHKL domain-containing protein [Candidatus Manganitrophaceae bacterium]